MPCRDCGGTFAQPLQASALCPNHSCHAGRIPVRNVCRDCSGAGCDECLLIRLPPTSPVTNADRYIWARCPSCGGAGTITKTCAASYHTVPSCRDCGGARARPNTVRVPCQHARAERCHTCHGNMFVERAADRATVPCPACRRTGIAQGSPCPDCRGAGSLQVRCSNNWHA